MVVLSVPDAESIMLGPPKSRHLDEPIRVSLEDLVPPNHFYRHLERTLDLAFVRDLVRDTYAELGRPSIDPVVFFKLQLILFFEGLRSERQLMRVVADRLSLRWYLGYDLTETAPRPLQPDPHPRALRAGGLPPLLRGDRRAVPRGGVGLGRGAVSSTATEVDGQCLDLDSLQPRFAVEAHLARLFAATEMAMTQAMPLGIRTPRARRRGGRSRHLCRSR